MQKDTICKLVRKYAGAASDAILDPSCNYFSVPSIEGFIAYKKGPSTAIVFGDPVCCKNEAHPLALAFKMYCNEEKLKPLYIMASSPFKDWALKNVSSASLQFGEELYLNPQINPFDLSGEKGSLVRRKVRRAEAEGVSVKEYFGDNTEIKQAILEVGEKWLHSRSGPQVHTSLVRTFENAFGKRWFYSLQQGKVTGVLILNRTEKNQGYLLNRYMVIPEAAAGTQELLVIRMLDILREEGCTMLCCGTVLANRTEKTEGLSPLSCTVASIGIGIANYLFNLKQRKLFWDKFQPEEQPSFLLFDTPSISIKELISLARALNIT